METEVKKKYNKFKEMFNLFKKLPVEFKCIFIIALIFDFLGLENNEDKQ